MGWSFTQASSRSLAVRPGKASSSSWEVTKETFRLSWGSTHSWGKTDWRVFWVSAMASTMDWTVAFRYSTFRSRGAMTFSQSHWST